ncbi:MAG: DNA-binding response regulator, partial [Ruthenibacterium sp.]
MNKLQVLVVEDDAAVRNLIATTLETHDYKFRTAVNGEEA